MEKSDYPRPNYFFDYNIEVLSKVLRDVNQDVKRLKGQVNGKNRIKFKTQFDIDYIDDLNSQEKLQLSIKTH